MQTEKSSSQYSYGLYMYTVAISYVVRSTIAYYTVTAKLLVHSGIVRICREKRGKLRKKTLTETLLRKLSNLT